MQSGPDNRSFCRFKNEISVIISDFDERFEELGQHYTEEEVNAEEIDQFLDENVLFKQNIWREVDAIEASLGCGREDSYPFCSDTTPSNGMDLPGSVVLLNVKCAVFAGNTVNKLAFKKFLA